MIQWPRNSPCSADRQHYNGIKRLWHFMQPGVFNKVTCICYNTKFSDYCRNHVRIITILLHILEELMSVLVELISGLALEGSVAGQLWRKGPEWALGVNQHPLLRSPLKSSILKDVTVYIVWMDGKWGMLNQRPILQDNWLAKWPH